MKIYLKYFFLATFIILFAYVVPASPDFPPPPPGSVQSSEPADMETPLRRAYFSYLSREEVMEHYMKHFSQYPTLRFNYPPEEAQTIIRDQTSSSFLEELAHPLRESIFINGFIPVEDKDRMYVDGVEYGHKTSVRYVPSSVLSRSIYVLVVSILGYVLSIELLGIAKEMYTQARRNLYEKKKN